MVHDINLSWRGGLDELVKNLEQQKKDKIDFVVDTRTVALEADGATMNDGGYLKLVPKAGENQAGEFITTPHRLSPRALEQLGERVKPSIPGKFAKELTAAEPVIAAGLYNSMMAKNPSRVLFRCLNGRVRAALSSKYRVFDDLDIAFNTLGTIKDKGGSVLECTASESRFEIKFTATHMVRHIPENRGGGAAEKHQGRSSLDPNDFKHLGVGAVCPFVRVSHSGVGEGGLNIGYGVLRLGCINGAVMDQMMNQIHLGSAMDIGMLSEETISVDSKAIMLKCRDLIRSSLDPSRFDSLIAIAKDAASDKILAPTAAVDNLVENSDLTDTDKEGILQYFLRDYDQNRWGLAQAVSRYSQDTDNPEDARVLEGVAGTLINSGSLIGA